MNGSRRIPGRSTRNCTIDYGVRQTITIPYKALWGNQVFFDPALYSASAALSTVKPTTGNVIVGSGNQYNGMVIPGSAWPGDALGHGVTQACGTTIQQPVPQLSGLLREHLLASSSRASGVAYQLNDKTVLRAGAGRYLTRFGLWDNIFPGANSPFQPFVTVNNVSVDNPGASLSSGTAAPITVTTHRAQHEALGIMELERRRCSASCLWKSTLEVAYIGRRGLHLPEVFDINQPQVGALLANPGVNVNALRPYEGFASIQMEESTATSMYNGLQVSWNRRFANGFSFGFSYTLSKSNDNGSNYRDIVPDTYNTSNLWGPSEFDTRHVVVFNYVYTLPFFKNSNRPGAQVAGQLADQRREPIPDRNALRHRHSTTITRASAKSAASVAAAKASSGI